MLEINNVNDSEIQRKIERKKERKKERKREREREREGERKRNTKCIRQNEKGSYQSCKIRLVKKKCVEKNAFKCVQ